MIHYKEIDSSLILQVEDIYRKESWNAYLHDREKLVRASEKSLYILGAFDDSRLAGFIRCVGDGEHVLLVQDLIVDPAYQKRSIGSHLFRTTMEKYAQVRMFLVITDIDDVVDNKFYRSFNFGKLEEKSMVGYVR